MKYFMNNHERILSELGFDLINVDLSFGPEILTYKSNDKSFGFKISLKVHTGDFRIVDHPDSKTDDLLNVTLRSLKSIFTYYPGFI